MSICTYPAVWEGERREGGGAGGGGERFHMRGDEKLLKGG